MGDLMMARRGGGGKTVLEVVESIEIPNARVNYYNDLVVSPGLEKGHLYRVEWDVNQFMFASNPTAFGGDLFLEVCGEKVETWKAELGDKYTLTDRPRSGTRLFALGQLGVNFTFTNVRLDTASGSYIRVQGMAVQIRIKQII